MDNKQFDAMFSGVIGQEYETLKLICPLAAKMSRFVGESIAEFAKTHSDKTLSVLELGGGTGITTLSILSSSESIKVVSVDSEPTMQSQAKQNLQQWVEQGRLTFDGRDALSVLRNTASASVDIMASAYTLHNFLDIYRAEVITEIYRVLKPGGKFINGDRYGLDDLTAHTRTIQNEVAGYFKALIEVNKLDVLQHWIVHLFSDESENHVMRESFSLQQLEQAGFKEIGLTNRCEVNALVTAIK
ncbi:tRNA (cmo5U34)-methyltransferase [Bathymodiolus platifrons methanotrophic gill symbiont]|uniref:class I SAM-dependent methyltransferase n=1 Tax=Bathymodiolus platifrons methanotrophic gill symbiont TaxID=113268 RepID=UPI0011CB03EF|nr:class I SAM-dependent methyltransferase [Bathymodiolus platifrons methanotrophic gill symbiont]TXK98904.1 SAM-dependent methyltransferase [Methylococcaceae bacterium HT1]TXL16526.1 SAM-dependent methyltransferase [Methylococcaceae bacterium HT3]TXL20347.1 SAM-dependent methyltransferase [Methylococcaceae bacterium HT5]GFO75281.1 tRNA (cmo5U34)-methyltransferase [Bathymodiolus platifrons methanotrophic gill symbiont]